MKLYYIIFILLFIFSCLTTFSQTHTDSLNYKIEIEKADKLFAKHYFEEAKLSYLKSLEHLPKEKYSKDRLYTCNERLNQQAAQKALYKRYDDAIAKGDECFVRKQISDARRYYTEACAVKPSESYPKNRIKDCDMLVKQMAEDAAYDKNILYALDLIKHEKYTEAQAILNNALNVKPNSPFCIDKINFCHEQIRKLMELDVQHNKLIYKGDSCLTIQDTITAKEFYAEAQKVKYDCALQAKIVSLDGEFYCCEQAQAPFSKEYVCAIKKGDFFFRLKKFTESISAYEEALIQDSDEQYPKDQIKLCKSLMKKK